MVYNFFSTRGRKRAECLIGTEIYLRMHAHRLVVGGGWYGCLKVYLVNGQRKNLVGWRRKGVAEVEIAF